MADVIPFEALRPRLELVEKIAALPYDVYNREEARKAVEGDAYSFLRIDRPETQFPRGYDMYASEVYEKARDMLWEMVEKGEFVKEQRPAYYVYELTMHGRTQTGIGACASVDDYENHVIMKHENTRAEKEADRIRHVDICNAQTGPIFLAYRQKQTIQEQIDIAKRKPPLYDFMADDGITHRVWRIDEEEPVRIIREGFAGIDKIYIADGHHRCASAVKVSEKRRKQQPDYTGKEAFNYFLAVLFPDEQLCIMDYNRVVKSLNGYTKEEFLDKVCEIFDMTEVGKTPYHPVKKGEIGMYLQDTWYKLTIRQGMLTGDAVKDLDVAILQDHLLAPILGILDPKSDGRIDFVGGIRGLEELERRVKTDSEVAFAMYPTDIHELFAVADSGKLMPPKSTWFEPKLRSGILIHALED
ncbi:MAG: DUF1015 family protein [Blautia sp.]|nr:DUF1015 family protein [Lachnoclostridium sp.]MCM1210575.1 DUF1015 family protein [Blautia sp.]